MFHQEIKKIVMMTKNGKVQGSVRVPLRDQESCNDAKEWKGTGVSSSSTMRLRKAVMMLKNGKVPESVGVPL